MYILDGSFDILSDRLFRIRIIKDASNLGLFIDIHHIINDGASAQLLLHDIEKAYNWEALPGEELSLTEEEILAIRWHMNAWDMPFQNSEHLGSHNAAKAKSPLVSLTQLADGFAAGLLER